jgi:hypothetical protein
VPKKIVDETLARGGWYFSLTADAVETYTNPASPAFRNRFILDCGFLAAHSDIAMWYRNALFIGLCLAGATWLAGSILRRDRIHSPKNADSRWFNDVSLRHSEQKLEVPQVRINQEFREYWKEKALQPAPSADSLTIVRRLSLGLTGTVPSLEEIRQLEKVPEEQRVQWWLSYLLEDRRFADYVAERLARPMVGTEDGPFIIYRRSRFVGWLADHLEKNTPYDVVVRDILGEEGLWTDNPPVNFVSVTVDADGTKKPDPIKLAARTARTFLATRIDCLQCHDDHLGTVNFGTEENPVPGEQEHFHELAAFFGEARLTHRGVGDRENEKYEVQYLGDEKNTVVRAQVPFVREAHGGHGRRREQLARWVTDPANKPFARATVNRIWAILFGKPLVEPIDDIPLQGPYPPALESLADDFAAHGFDLHRLIRAIASSEVFQLDSAADFEITEEHEQQWAVFPLTRLRPEQVAGAMIQSSQVGTIDSEAHILWKLIKFGQTQEFVKRYGDTGTDEFTDRAATIPQRLLMMNGELVKERTQPNPVLNASHRIAILAPTDEAAIEASYLAAFTRRPTTDELQHFASQLAGKRDQPRAQAMEDLYWTLVNSSEFSWNH